MSSRSEVPGTILTLPDLPRWVEAHGMAADPASWQRALGNGVAVGHDTEGLIVVAGDADLAEITALAALPHAMIFARDDLARATGRSIVRIGVHTLPGDDPAAAFDEAVPDLEGALRLPDDAALDHLPPALAGELARWRRARPIWTAYVDGEPVSFAYAPWRSARWFDISVYTAPGARQLGLGRLVTATLIRDELAQGRAPVWGAEDDDAAGLRLGRALGFVEIDALWLAAP